MIASPVHHQPTLCSTALSNCTCTPVKVSDRIAFFEEKALASTFHQPRKTSEGINVASFLASIGQVAPPTFDPKLWRLEFEWKKRVQKRVDERKTDAGFYSLSKELDQLDAILYSDSTLLEIETLNLVSCSNREAYDDDKSEKEKEEEDYDSSQELPALESGALELAKELEDFARLCGDNRDPSQTR
jgi:hypothetical protein